MEKRSTWEILINENVSSWFLTYYVLLGRIHDGRSNKRIDGEKKTRENRVIIMRWSRDHDIRHSWRSHAYWCVCVCERNCKANMLFSLSSGPNASDSSQIWRAKRVLKTDGTWQTWLSKGNLLTRTCTPHTILLLLARALCYLEKSSNHLLRLVLPFYHSWFLL